MMKDFHFQFHGRPKLSGFRKRVYIMIGVVELTIGFYGLFNIDPSSNLFLLFLVLLISGTVYILIALSGRRFWAEHNFIKKESDVIKYKNSHRKPKSIKMDKLADIIVDGRKVEFVNKDNTISVYKFSAFPDSESNEISSVLKHVREYLILENNEKPLNTINSSVV